MSKLSQQALVAIIGYIIIAVAMLVSFMNGTKEMLGSLLFRFAVFCLMAALSVYVINCTVVGSCHLYAWVMGYAIAVFGTIAVIVALLKK